MNKHKFPPGNKIVSLFIFFTFVNHVGRAANDTSSAVKRTEFSIGSGIASADRVYDGLSPGFLFSRSTKNYVIEKYSGAHSITCSYYINKLVNLGICFSYENESGTWQTWTLSGSDYWTNTKLGSFRRQAFTVAGQLSLIYSSEQLVKFYGLLGIGYTFENEIDTYLPNYNFAHYQNGKNELGPEPEIANNRYHFNMQFSPFGVRVGKRLSWYAEMGIGYKGMISTGLTFRP